MRGLLNGIRRFFDRKDGRSGNVAIIFSIAIVPLIGGIGAAMDYAVANSNKTAMQKALDATALALAKMMPLTQAELNTKGWQLFSANLPSVQAVITQADLVITAPAVGKIDLSVTGKYNAQMVAILGIDHFPVGAKAQVQWGMKKLELALALDNTGSMGWSNKMTELKKAAKNLLTTLQNSAKTPGDVKVAIVPFHVQVNVGNENHAAAWLDFTEWDSDNQECTTTTSGKGKGKDSGGVTTCVPKSHTNWTGCVRDRDQSNDVLDTTPAVANSTKFPAVNCSYSLAKLMPLSYDWTALAARIDAMEPDGNTNVTIGLSWAWHALTNNLPLTEAAVDATEISRVIILMTDGDNTQNRWTSNENSINNRTSAACTNIKAAGIQIYTIRVIDGNATLLQNCATDPSMYFNVQNASQLSSVFNSIGQTLAKLHLSQ